MDRIDLKILYEDNHILVALKPPGVLSQSGDKDLPDMLTQLKAYLKEKYHKPGNAFLGLVHRLDLNVSGVMIFAKTSKAASRISESIREHSFQKRYYAVVTGRLPMNYSQELFHYLSKDETAKIASVTDQISGKEARLNFTVLDVISTSEYDASLIDVELFTGRFHQIRAQLSSFGHPLLGDVKYGGSRTRKNEVALFSYQIELEHPITKEHISFSTTPMTKIFLQFPYFQKQNSNELNY